MAGLPSDRAVGLLRAARHGDANRLYVVGELVGVLKEQLQRALGWMVGPDVVLGLGYVRGYSGAVSDGEMHYVEGVVQAQGVSPFCGGGVVCSSLAFIASSRGRFQECLWHRGQR